MRFHHSNILHSVLLNYRIIINATHIYHIPYLFDNRCCLSCYVKRKERQLIERVTPITRGEWSERRVVLNLLKGGINPKAIFHDLYIQKPNGEYTQVDVAVAT